MINGRLLDDAALRTAPAVFYCLHDEGVFQGAVLTYVDDLLLAGSNAFIEKMRLGISDE